MKTVMIKTGFNVKSFAAGQPAVTRDVVDFIIQTMRDFLHEQ